MLTSLYLFDKKDYGCQGKDALFDTMDVPSNIVAAIEEFANLNKDDAVSALHGFVDEENDD